MEDYYLRFYYLGILLLAAQNYPNYYGLSFSISLCPAVLSVSFILSGSKMAAVVLSLVSIDHNPDVREVLTVQHSK